jgi:transcriptional regulator with XRE-family HTH domain
MARIAIDELKRRRIDAMSPEERAAFDKTYEATRLAMDVGEKIRAAREAAGLSQRELAARMTTSQAAVARLEAGGVGATLTTLQKVSAAFDLKVIVELTAATWGATRAGTRRTPEGPGASYRTRNSWSQLLSATMLHVPLQRVAADLERSAFGRTIPTVPPPRGSRVRSCTVIRAAGDG